MNARATLPLPTDAEQAVSEDAGWSGPVDTCIAGFGEGWDCCVTRQADDACRDRHTRRNRHPPPTNDACTRCGRTDDGDHTININSLYLGLRSLAVDANATGLVEGWGWLRAPARDADDAGTMREAFVVKLGLSPTLRQYASAGRYHWVPSGFRLGATNAMDADAANTRMKSAAASAEHPRALAIAADAHDARATLGRQRCTPPLPDDPIEHMRRAVATIGIARRFDDEDRIPVIDAIVVVVVLRVLRLDDRPVLRPIHPPRFHVLSTVIGPCHDSLLSRVPYQLSAASEFL